MGTIRVYLGFRDSLNDLLWNQEKERERERERERESMVEDVEEVVERVRENLEAYRGLQEPMRVVFERLSEAHRSIRSAVKRNGFSGSGSEDQQQALVLKRLERRGGEAEHLVRERPDVDVERVVFEENVSFGKMKALRERQEALVSELKRDVHALVNTTDLLADEKKSSEIFRLAEKLDLVERDFSMKEYMIDKCSWQSSDEEAFVHNILLSLDPFSQQPTPESQGG